MILIKKGKPFFFYEGNKKLKESITNWINKMKKNKFYRNYFLEDILSRVL